MENIDLNERPRSRDELACWYTAALEEQASSGLSMAEYADELGVAPTTLYQWKRRLCAEDHAEFETPASFGLVEVSVEDRSSAKSTDDAGHLVVRVGEGRYVEVPPRFDDGELMRLIAVLESC